MHERTAARMAEQAPGCRRPRFPSWAGLTLLNTALCGCLAAPAPNDGLAPDPTAVQTGKADELKTLHHELVLIPPDELSQYTFVDSLDNLTLAAAPLVERSADTTSVATDVVPTRAALVFAAPAAYSFAVWASGAVLAVAVAFKAVEDTRVYLKHRDELQAIHVPSEIVTRLADQPPADGLEPYGSTEAQQAHAAEIKPQIASLQTWGQGTFFPAPADRALDSGSTTRRRYVVFLKNRADRSALGRLADDFGVQVQDTYSIVPGFTTGPMDPDTAFELSLAIDRVRAVEEVQEVDVDPELQEEKEADLVPLPPPEPDRETQRWPSANPRWPRRKPDDPCRPRYPWKLSDPSYEPSPGAPPWYLDRSDQKTPELDCRFEPFGTGAGVRVYILGQGIKRGYPPLQDVPFIAGYGDEVYKGEHDARLAYLIHRMAPDARIASVNVGLYTTNEAIYAALEWLQTQHKKPAVLVIASVVKPHKNMSDGIMRMLAEVAQEMATFATAGNKICDVSRSPWARLPRENVLVVGGSALVDTPAPADLIYENLTRRTGSGFGDCVRLYAPAGSLEIPGHRIFNGVTGSVGLAAAAGAIYLSKRPRALPAEVIRDMLASAGPSQGPHPFADGMTAASLLYVGMDRKVLH